MSTSFKTATVVAAGVACLLALGVGCSREADPPPEAITPAPRKPAPTPEPAPAPVEKVASATVAGLSGSTVTGTVTFRETAGGGVSVEAHLNGLSPNGKHGFHIHQVGDCSGDGSAAGDHFNPGGHPHAGPDAALAHAGDMGNLTADGTGHAMMTMVLRSATLGDGPDSLVGRSVLVHAGEDDLTSQPAGNSGARIGCGVIQAGGSTATGTTSPSGTTSTTGETHGAEGASGATSSHP